MKHPWLSAIGAATITLALSGEALATDFQLSLGASGHGTDWRGDATTYGSLRLGLRFMDLFGVYFEGAEGYGVVDERVLTMVALGAQIWGRLGITRPYARLAAFHQHEETLIVYTEDVGSALFGVGDGIRHRFGGELGVGLDVPFYTRKDLSFFAGADANAKILPDDLGPFINAGGGLKLGLNYEI